MGGNHCDFNSVLNNPMLEGGRGGIPCDTEHGAASVWMAGVVVHCLAFGSAPVHVFVGAGKNYSVAEWSGTLKGASRRIRLECRERVRGKLWGEHFWSGGYFQPVCAVHHQGQAIRLYIQNSQRKHWHALDYEE